MTDKSIGRSTWPIKEIPKTCLSVLLDDLKAGFWGCNAAKDYMLLYPIQMQNLERNIFV